MPRRALLPLAALLLCAGTLAAPAAGAAPRASDPPRPLRILLTNDDGYDAPGIRMLYDRLTAAGHDVTIVAPLTNQSGAGTRMSSGPTIGVLHPQPKVWAVDGSPADAVSFGLSAVFARHAPDLVLSGTNFGPNLAAMATHSGTVGAAVTALEDGVPAIAVSTGGLRAPVSDRILNAMRPTDDFVLALVDQLRDRAHGGRLLPEGVGLDVDHPVLGADGTGTARGTDVTTQDPRPVLEPEYADNGDGTWKVTVGVVDAPARPGSDVAAVDAGRISVSPITPGWNPGPGDYARTAALVAGLRP
ncbi:5'-nucleotidase /3'-nucleotidase /exopolyphosphatase [Streptomyces puniciscabiei]|uniref:5'-nucleotidase n=1 Tax=Streptomyces puniciscabiei TaxID=164348 RepID=A0A542TIF9_9ACTN|nr:5'/3'-nucleotidase SurE [Streptomyces puniciscabiei]TQK86624.1 5'-nucleotidase /3'-nucleotidase /exopolyphosphatase [Streptomyces puniciscabiei]